MILNGNDILFYHDRGNIVINPFDISKLNPNSYNLTLHDELIVYDDYTLDMAEDNSHHTIKIPETGLMLTPGTLYLGRTNEYTETYNFVPMLEGRSSVGRLGLYIHVTAGFGDNGFKGYWTLELSCVQPLIIYPNINICQIYYHSIGDFAFGDSKPLYEGKYQNNTGIQTSQLYKEIKK